MSPKPLIQSLTFLGHAWPCGVLPFRPAQGPVLLQHFLKRHPTIGPRSSSKLLPALMCRLWKRWYIMTASRSVITLTVYYHGD